MLYNTQNDNRWADFKYDRNYTLGSYGCYITSIANILDITPLQFAELTAGCYTDGLLIHEKAGYKAGYIRTIVDRLEQINNSNYIVHFYWGEKGYHHFSNIIRRDSGMLYIYNVYTGERQYVHNGRIINIIRIDRCEIE